MDILGQMVEEQQKALRELKAARREAPNPYLDKLIANVRDSISGLRQRQKKAKGSDPKRRALILDVAQTLDLSMRHHLPMGLDPAIVLFAAERVVEEVISKRSRKAVNARYNQKGGSREKAASLLKEYATGKYPTKTECAEHAQMHRGMTHKTAMKVLRNAPKPRR
jgi:hypothetical protein